MFISTSKVYALLLSFGNAGFYISYTLPVVGLAYLRYRHRWVPGEHTMGKWSGPVTYTAAVWIVLETINIAWPRNLYGTWYLNWGLLIMTGVLAVVGFFIVQWAFNPNRAHMLTPAGDAVVVPEA
jgi:amino acid transporter